MIDRNQEIAYFWRESTSSDRSTLRGTQGKSSPEQGDEITTDNDNDDQLMPERCLTDEEADFSTLFINWKMRHFILGDLSLGKFWTTSPQTFGFKFLTPKTEEEKFSDKEFATRKETPSQFFNCVWLKIVPLQIKSWHLVNFEN